MVRRKLIRSFVEQLINDNEIRSAPVPVAKIARSLGVQVQRTPAEDELSGFLYRDRKNKIAIIGVNADHHPNRQNFTIGHELGHFLLHDFDDVHVDKVWLRNAASSEGSNIEEREANLFSAELLMPARFLEHDIADRDDLLDEEVIKELAEKYGVSIQAMTIRLTSLGILEQ